MLARIVIQQWLLHTIWHFDYLYSPFFGRVVKEKHTEGWLMGNPFRWQFSFSRGISRCQLMMCRRFLSRNDKIMAVFQTLSGSCSTKALATNQCVNVVILFIHHWATHQSLTSTFRHTEFDKMNVSHAFYWALRDQYLLVGTHQSCHHHHYSHSTLTLDSAMLPCLQEIQSAWKGKCVSQWLSWGLTWQTPCCHCHCVDHHQHMMPGVQDTCSAY